MLTPDICASRPETVAAIEATAARRATLGALEIRRALPARERRMVGPWCFLDRYGPLSFNAGRPMDLGPHPHTGLQTVSWLMEGELLHRDSLGSRELLTPGRLNLMTAGAGIAHSEETPAKHSGRLSGVQLWVALPDASINTDPAFEHHPELPVAELSAGRLTVFLGEAASVTSPASTFSPVLGADLEVHGGKATVPLRPDFEYALLVLEGDATLDREPIVPDVLYYLGTGRHEMAVSATGKARVLLVGGEPFAKPVLMWWNFVARSHEEIMRAATDWNQGRRFGTVDGYDGPPIPAPPLRGRAKPPAAS